MKKIERFQHGIGIGGWLANYKRVQLLPVEQRTMITIGDMEHFESYITEKDVAYIASLGMDHIRLPFEQVVLEEKPYIYRERILELMKDFVGWCKKYNLRVVFDMHTAIGNTGDPSMKEYLAKDEELQKRYISTWLKLEEVFHEDNEIFFELLNEVINSTAEEWNAVAEKAIRAIREKNPERKIIMGVIDWCNPPGLRNVQVFDDDNVLYTFHMYEPHEFTHQQGLLMGPKLLYNRKMEYPSVDIEKYRDYQRLIGNDTMYSDIDTIDIEYLRSYMQPAKDFIDAHPDKILWCGEFGSIRHCNIRYRENWMRDVITILKEWDIPYSVWNYLSTPNDGNKFSLVDDETREILSEEMARIIRGEVER